MMSITGLSTQLGLGVFRNGRPDMIVLTGERGTVVFNPRLRGVLVGDQVLFRGHRVVVRNGQVSVPAGFVAECEKRLKPRAPARPIAPRRPDYRRFHVVIDPGHGGRDPGAIGVRSGYEKTVNLLTAEIAAARLRAAGVRVTMTRSSDVFIPLNERAAIGNRAGADAFISIHADSNGSSAPRGFSVYVCHTKPSYSDSARASKIFGECGLSVAACRAELGRNRALSGQLASLIRLELGEATEAPDRGTHLGAFRVLERSLCPAVLVELGFMSNPHENARLLEAGYQDRLGSAIAAATLRLLDER